MNTMPTDLFRGNGQDNDNHDDKVVVGNVDDENYRRQCH